MFSLWLTKSIALKSVFVNLSPSLFGQLERLLGPVAIKDSMENGRKFLDLSCCVCVDNVDAGCGWVDTFSRLNAVSIVA
jgi:hypothetical protein